ncbi:hypothetical protein GEPA3_1948, partial [Geobacillus sp. PA-3]|uniref:hypothetical protein n=1 Tax=Geobacillus sp. PA-3 TaxID=1699078 RepID=UPI0006E70A99
MELARKYIHIDYTKDKGGIARKWFTIHEIKKNDKKGRQGKIVEKVALHHKMYLTIRLFSDQG